MRRSSGNPVVKVLLVVLLAMSAGCSSAQAQSTPFQPPSHDSAVQQSTPAADPASPGALVGATASAQPPVPWWGLTVDSIDNLDGTVAAIAALPVPPVVRLVFDVGEDPASYRSAVTRLSEHADVMALVVDSSDFAALTVDEYLARFRSMVSLYGDQIDLWEIGNEVNGEWLGRPADVVQAITGAEQIVRAQNLTPVLTLYYNPQCADDPAHEMFTWVEQQLSSDFRDGQPYVLLSYYPDQCGNRWPDAATWQSTFDRVGTLFPHALVGIGEVGISDDHASAADKVNLVNSCYGLHIQSDRYVGGCFWWYFVEDAVPHAGNPVWNALVKNMQGG
jgi:hypothetical protein